MENKSEILNAVTNGNAKNAPWYVSGVVTRATLVREFTRAEPECVIRSISDLEAIVRIAQDITK